MSPTPIQGTSDIEAAIASFTDVLATLRESHARLEDRAQRVEDELCDANSQLASKVDELDGLGQHLESILASIPSGVVEMDERGRVVRANDAAHSILGLAPGSLRGLCELPGLDVGFEQGVAQEVVRPDGRRRVVVLRRSPLASSCGRPLGTVLVLDDQTALVRTRERVHRLDKSAALGTMVGGVAHEIRNPLHAIQGFAQLLVRETDPESRAHNHAARIREGAREIESIVASMLGLASTDGLHVTDFDALELAKDVAARALEERGDGGRWIVEVDGVSHSARADRLKLRQALRNLVANACDAQPDGGQVRVGVEAVGESVHFHVSDAGPGVAPEDIDRICDPFFTTRAEGTGLGLALVARIAELHGGRLELQDGAGPLGGARFSLSVPQPID